MSNPTLGQCLSPEDLLKLLNSSEPSSPLHSSSYTSSETPRSLPDRQGEFQGTLGGFDGNWSTLDNDASHAMNSLSQRWSGGGPESVDFTTFATEGSGRGGVGPASTIAGSSAVAAGGPLQIDSTSSESACNDDASKASKIDHSRAERERRKSITRGFQELHAMLNPNSSKSKKTESKSTLLSKACATIEDLQRKLDASNAILAALQTNNSTPLDALSPVVSQKRRFSLPEAGVTSSKRQRQCSCHAGDHAGEAEQPPTQPMAKQRSQQQHQDQHRRCREASIPTKLNACTGPSTASSTPQVLSSTSSDASSPDSSVTASMGLAMPSTNTTTLAPTSPVSPGSQVHAPWAADQTPQAAGPVWTTELQNAVVTLLSSLPVARAPCHHSSSRSGSEQAGRSGQSSPLSTTRSGQPHTHERSG